MGEKWPNDMRDGRDDKPDYEVKIVDCPFCTGKNGMELQNLAGDKTHWSCFICGSNTYVQSGTIPSSTNLGTPTNG